MRIVAGLLIVCSMACTPRTVPPPPPRISAEELAKGLDEADRLASRGCYLCLKEAAAAYSALLAVSDDPVLLRKALENSLMILAREIELRMPDSGAREAAAALQLRVPSSYAGYLAAIDTPPNPFDLLRNTPLREERLKLVANFETDAPASVMKAYFYLALALQMLPVKEIQPKIDAVLAAHPDDLSLKYRKLGYQPTYSGDAARELIGMETGFGEVHFLMGQRAVMGGNLGSAFRDFTRAHELLPDSISISFGFAGVQMSYARYAEALALFDRILGAGPDDSALLGRARALSYLRRHEDAIAAIDESLKDAQNNPGEKYYWRAWNRLQMKQPQLALDDAMLALNAMRNNQVYNLAGMAAFSLSRLAESRDYFENAVQMNRGDCDSERYLAQIDSIERSWKAAAGRFAQAATCYEQAIVRMRKELATYEEDITGLSNGLITGKRMEIKDAEALRISSVNNAAVASKNAGLSK
jgi:tetratricopeptide (TPR) repeat protein